MTILDFLSIKFDKHKSKEQQMAKSAKQVVKFTGGEFKPKYLASGLVGFKAPLDFNLDPGATAEIDLKMTCDATLVFEIGTVLPSTNITVFVKNKTSDKLMFLAGDVIARAYPLARIDYEIG
jgi:hypothetical protein